MCNQKASCTFGPSIKYIGIFCLFVFKLQCGDLRLKWHVTLYIFSPIRQQKQRLRSGAASMTANAASDWPFRPRPLTPRLVARVEHGGQAEPQAVVGLHRQLSDVLQPDGGTLPRGQAAHTQGEHVRALLTLLQ